MKIYWLIQLRIYWVPAMCQTLCETLGIQRWIGSARLLIPGSCYTRGKRQMINSKWANKNDCQLAASVIKKIQQNDENVTGHSEGRTRLDEKVNEGVWKLTFEHECRWWVEQGPFLSLEEFTVKKDSKTTFNLVYNPKQVSVNFMLKMA